MRTETLWQSERRAARTRWWHQVLEPQSILNGKDLFDEELTRRFPRPEPGHNSIGRELLTATSC